MTLDRLESVRPTRHSSSHVASYQVGADLFAYSSLAARLYLQKLITNHRVARYLEQYQPELFIEFQKIAEMTSTLASEAA